MPGPRGKDCNQKVQNAIGMRRLNLGRLRGGVAWERNLEREGRVCAKAWRWESGLLPRWGWSEDRMVGAGPATSAHSR